MATEGIQTFVEKVNADEQVRDGFLELTGRHATWDEYAEFAAQNGCDCNADELKELVMTAIATVEAGDEISDADLDAVAGGRASAYGSVFRRRSDFTSFVGKLRGTQKAYPGNDPDY